MEANVILGTSMHAVGALCAAVCYTPQNGLRRWSWQTYWLAQASVCWFILPFVVGGLTIPNLTAVLTEAPRQAVLLTFFLGAVYGIGGTAFGLAIRHIGFSLTYAIAIGISCVLGTITGPILRMELMDKLAAPGGGWLALGLVIGTAGIFLCGIAGRLKELGQSDHSGEVIEEFSLARGLPLVVLAGVLSAIYGVAVNDASAPIAALAESYGAGVWQMNAVYIFANPGAFITTSIYCLYLIRKEQSSEEFVEAASEGRSFLLANYGLAFLTGCLWYSQFLFYGLGHVRMGDFKFSSWALHMIMLILFSTGAGLILREWVGTRRWTRLTLAAAISILSAAILLITYGNHLATT